MELSYAPFTPFMTGPTKQLPGIAPMDMADWLHRDEAYAEQMAYRDRLITDERDVVFAAAPEVAGPSGELLDMVKDHLSSAPDHDVGEALTRPDGARVPLTGDHPLALLARMTQEDWCILWKPENEDEHVLIGAALLFPSRWSLAEKMGKPLIVIHSRVPQYDDSLAPRVQRFFDAIQPGRALVRANWLVHTTPELHQPLTEAAKAKRDREPKDQHYLRVERQTLIRLPHSRAIVFGIKTVVTATKDLADDQRAGLLNALENTPDEIANYHGGLAYHQAAIAALRAL